MTKPLPPNAPTVYGIPNCDSVKKARSWMDANHIAYHFHDFKKQGVSEELLNAWMASVGWEVLVNRKGTTWRKLPPEVQNKVVDAASACKLMLEHASVIKRPVVVANAKLAVGVNPELWRSVVDE